MIELFLPIENNLRVRVTLRQDVIFINTMDISPTKRVFHNTPKNREWQPIYKGDPNFNKYVKQAIDAYLIKRGITK